ncbi:MAG: hypothetical protein HFF39_11395 [Lawsonibacter sp.]|nr:hypothetical protein [Lawsonibacter sp.]
MRRRRRIQLDLLCADRAAVLLLGALFLAGGAAGCAAAGSIGGEAGEALREYLTLYLSLAGSGGAEVSFGRVLWEQLCFPLFTLLLGFTALGLVGIPLLFAAKGFLFSFCVSCFCRLFGGAGLAPAVFLFGLPALLWAPALFVLGTQGVSSSFIMFRRCLGDNRAPAFLSGVYWMKCALCGGAAALCVALEYLVLPALVGASARFVS